MVMVRPNWSLEAIVIVFGACCIVYAVVDLINLWLIGRQREALGKE